ncbi:MAG: L,D-transpeptidase/peptidoglycan binding protein [Patescibacteria group bacterium]
MNNLTTTATKLNILPSGKTKTKQSKATTKKKSLVISKQTYIKIGISFLVITTLISGVWYFNRAYADKIYPKVMVAGIKVGGLTHEQAKTQVEEKIKILENNGPEITYNDQTVKPTLSEMGITFDTDKILDQAFNYGRGESLKEKLQENYQLAISGFVLEIKPQIDEVKFNEYLSQLSSVVEKEPKNATLSIENGQVNLTPSEKGRGLNKDQLKNDLTALINSGNISGSIVMQTSDLEPAINDEGTTEAKSQAEKYLTAAPITVTFDTSSWSAGSREISSWIKFNEDGDKLATSISPNAFVNWVAEQVEVPATDREVEDGTGNVISEGQDGRGVDTDTLTAQIRDALARSQSSSFAMVTSTIPRGQKTIYPHAQPGRYGSKYIDINLSEQTLYAFEGSTLVNQFLVSTGKSGYATPTGEFSVYGKDRAALMDGPDYYLPGVPYISWFSGDYSIHGTYWHSNFGHPMSHGCVNMATSDAEWIFNWDDVGTPVYIHY